MHVFCYLDIRFLVKPLVVPWKLECSTARTVFAFENPSSSLDGAVEHAYQVDPTPTELDREMSDLLLSARSPIRLLIVLAKATVVAGGTVC